MPSRKNTSAGREVYIALGPVTIYQLKLVLFYLTRPRTKLDTTHE